MSDKLAINPLPTSPHYSGHLHLRSLHKAIRSSSSRGTNISSSPKSASLIPDYLVPVPHSPIRSSKKSAIFYSILFVKTQISLEGGFEPDLNGFLNQKQSAPTAGRVEPQLNGFCSTIGNAPKVAFELDSFRLCAAVNLRFPQAIHSPRCLGERISNNI
jgi:hypothetical protein